MFQPEALILDFDGVLADSIKAHTVARIRAFDELGYHVDPQLHEEGHRHGSHPHEIIGWVLKQAGFVAKSADVRRDSTVQRVVELKDQIFFDETSLGLDAIEGAVEFVQWAHEKPFEHELGIATTAYRATEVNPFLHRHQLWAAFEVTVTHEDTPRDAFKPHPFVYLEAASKIKAPRYGKRRVKEIAAVEDTPRGIQAAKAAKLLTVGITTTHPASDLSEADIIVDSFEQLKSLLLVE